MLTRSAGILRTGCDCSTCLFPRHVLPSYSLSLLFPLTISVGISVLFSPAALPSSVHCALCLHPCSPHFSILSQATRSFEELAEIDDALIRFLPMKKGIAGFLTSVKVMSLYLSLSPTARSTGLGIPLGPEGCAVIGRRSGQHLCLIQAAPGPPAARPGPLGGRGTALSLFSLSFRRCLHLSLSLSSVRVCGGVCLCVCVLLWLRECDGVSRV